MKQLFLISAATLLALAAQAQTTFSFGPRAGLNSGRAANPTFGGYFENQRLYLGAQAGVAAQLRRGAWALQPALLFSQKGNRERAVYSQDLGQGLEMRRVTISQRFNYLELAAPVAYAPAWARGAQIFAGPYAAVGVGGRYQEYSEPTTAAGSAAVRNGWPVRYAAGIGDSRSAHAKRLDWGLNAGLGYQAGPLLLQAQYSWSRDNAISTIPEYRRFLRTTSLALTYLFGRPAALSGS